MYSDGWVEQGGLFGGGSGVLQISLPISMKDTNYDLSVNANVSDGTYFGTGYKIAKESIYVWTTNYVGTNTRQANSMWCVKGMSIRTPITYNQTNNKYIKF